MDTHNAIITGGAKGIGLATARVLLCEGYDVALLDIDARGESVVSQLDTHGHQAMFVRCDVSCEDQVQRAVQAACDRLGPARVLVNNAGIQRYSTVTTTTEAEWDLVMNVNLKSAFLCAKHAIPNMLTIGEGVVVNVASVQSFHSQANVAPYTTAKTALLGLTRSIAVDYAPTVRCVAVCPGTVDTPMLRDAIKVSLDPQAILDECNNMHLGGRIGRPEEIASLIAFLVSDRAAFINGQPIRIDGGLGVGIGGSKMD
jgi:NAD(P)-dependent dehydrogenase (short-subunit alcohol dehydrogenase family)